MDTNRVRELLDQRDAIDEELKVIVTGTEKRKPQKCSLCQSEEHSARTCPDKPPKT